VFSFAARRQKGGDFSASPKGKKEFFIEFCLLGIVFASKMTFSKKLLNFSFFAALPLPDLLSALFSLFFSSPFHLFVHRCFSGFLRKKRNHRLQSFGISENSNQKFGCADLHLRRQQAQTQKAIG